jgi:putative FmdB family regulatory protein
MPTYDYVCDACGHVWEEFQSITSEPTSKCPECNKKKARRRIGPGAGIIFKGSGFYQTDYRSDSYKKSADADSKAAGGGGESKSEGKSDSKGSQSGSGSGGTEK